jgi:hypothetical protein
MSQPYLFYSERCANSKQIIETLKALNKTSLYKFILVESLARDKIPSFLKAVPTLYVPDTKEVVVGKEIYGYIAKPTNSRKELPTKETNSAGASVGGAAQHGEYSAWGGFESNGLSESYSLWDNPGQFSSMGGSMYTFLDGSAPNTGGAGMPSGGPTTQNTIAKSKTGGNDDVMSRMESMTNQRKAEYGSVERK